MCKVCLPRTWPDPGARFADSPYSAPNNASLIAEKTLNRLLDSVESLFLPSVTIRIDELTELRILQLGDAEQVFELTDKNRTYLREWLPWVDSNQTVSDTRRFIQTIINQFKSNEGFQCGIWNEGKLKGVVGFHRIDWLNKNVEIGYWIAREYQGSGLITRSCKAMIDYAFREFNLKRVQIRCATGNIRSCAIPERLGFQKEGIVRQAEYLYGRFVDLVVYGMIDTDWKKLSESSPS